MAVVLLASLGARAPGMSESIWYDEYWRTFHVLGDPERLRSATFRDVHGFVYNGFMFLWIHAFGDAEPVIRLPSLLAGYGSLVLFWRWARRRVGEAPAGLAAVWAALSPVHVWFSTEAKNNAFSLLAATLVLVAYDRLAERPGRGRFFAAVGAGAFGVFTDFSVLLALLPISAAWAVVAYRSGDRGLLRRLAVAGVATVLLTLPWILFKASHARMLHREYATDLNFLGLVTLLGSWFPTGDAFTAQGRWLVPVSAVLFALLAPLLALGAARVARRPGGGAAAAAFGAPLLILLVLPPALGALGYPEFRVYQERNLLVLLYLYGLLAMVGAMALPRCILRAGAAALVLGCAVAGTLCILTVRAESHTVMRSNPDWRGAGRALLQDADAEIAAGLRRPGEAPLVLSKSPVEPLPYYAPGVDAVRLEVPEGRRLRVDRVEAMIRARGVRTFWWVNDTGWQPLRQPELESLTERFDLLGAHSFGRRMVLYRFGVRDGGQRPRESR